MPDRLRARDPVQGCRSPLQKLNVRSSRIARNIKSFNVCGSGPNRWAVALPLSLN
jgi:hypothetical protein